MSIWASIHIYLFFHMFVYLIIILLLLLLLVYYSVCHSDFITRRIVRVAAIIVRLTILFDNLNLTAGSNSSTHIPYCAQVELQVKQIEVSRLLNDRQQRRDLRKWQKNAWLAKVKESEANQRSVPI